mgnify:CR=1 FL=1
MTFVKTHVVVCLGLAGNWLSSRASSKRKQATKETLMRRSFAKKNALLLTYMKKSLLSSYIIIIYLPFQLVSSKQWRPDTYCISKVSVCSDFQTLGKPKFQNVQHNFLFLLQNDFLERPGGRSLLSSMRTVLLFGFAIETEMNPREAFSSRTLQKCWQQDR